MSLSSKNLSLIQKAGHATHNASEAISASVTDQAQRMVASVATQPFGAESEQAFARFKMLARLNQGLASVEAQLKELFGIAMELANPASDVVIALPYAAKRESSNAAAVDAIANPARKSKGAKGRLKAKKASKTAKEPGSLTANDTTLLQFLQGSLKVGEETRLTGGAMAAGSGLPLGSVGVSLKKILATGNVISSGRGLYRLGGASGAQVPVLEVKSKPAKKAKSAKVKKAKPAVQPQEPAPSAEASAG